MPRRSDRAVRGLRSVLAVGGRGPAEVHGSLVVPAVADPCTTALLIGGAGGRESRYVGEAAAAGEPAVFTDLAGNPF
jgi:hypothetical protein